MPYWGMFGGATIRMPAHYGDHMSVQGGFMKTNTDVYELYVNHFNMVNSL